MDSIFANLAMIVGVYAGEFHKRIMETEKPSETISSEMEMLRVTYHERNKFYR